MNLYLGVFILFLYPAFCSCYVAYEMFQGFDITTAQDNATTSPNIVLTSSRSVTRKMRIKSPPTERSNHQHKKTKSPTTATEVLTTTPIPPLTSSKFQCPENEAPSNIGAYEVPTQRDIVLLVRKTLVKMFNNYHEKALYFLKDIREATRATSGIEKKCHGYGTDLASYRKCVRQVSNKCELVTKGLVSSLERQRADVAAFTNGTVCNVKGMKADPVDLIKTLAMEEASLEFALPGFLRLLNACSSYCDKIQLKNKPKKPLRHMTDQDLVVKHFLTKKNYIQLLKGSK